MNFKTQNIERVLLVIGTFLALLLIIHNLSKASTPPCHKPSLEQINQTPAHHA